MTKVWHIRWRGDEYDIQWEDGALRGDDAATTAFARYAVSNAPQTDLPAEERLADPAITAAMLHEFADEVLWEGTA